MAEIKGLTIGARVLDKNQMNDILPGYSNIYKQIKSMREFAKAYNNREEKLKKEKKTTNNVFSILGGRGAEKSSVLET